ncbi:TPA: response regulator [Vibrio parahaemolyticus]
MVTDYKQLLITQLEKLHEKQEGANSIASQSALKLAGANILLVEDDAINQVLISRLLTNKNINVIIANNGQEALDTLANIHVNGIIMDCQMPVLDGYTASKKIRQNPKHASLPIIALTANISAIDKQKMFDSGMNDHIPKPIEIDRLLTCLANWITH